MSNDLVDTVSIGIALNAAGFAACGGGPVPVRRPLSVRRTTTIDIDWPNGGEGETRFRARCRDALADQNGALGRHSHDWVEAFASETREFSQIRSSRQPSGITELAGSRGGGKFRSLLRAAFPEPEEQLSGHYLLLDDLAGASLVSSWGKLAWTREFNAFAVHAKARGIGGEAGNMRGVCIGLAEGSGALDADGYPRVEQQSSTRVPDLANPEDPDGWHETPRQAGPGTRRARWIDVWRNGGFLHASGGFQDSAAQPDGGWLAIHEYRFEAAIDEASGLIASIRAIPQVLPHRECPAAVLGAGRLVGRPVSDLRTDVPVLFAREAGCTHLNDVLRALVCVPALACQLG